MEALKTTSMSAKKQDNISNIQDNTELKEVLVKIAFCAEQLSHQYRTACGTAQGVVRKADKLVIVLSILAQTADRYSHNIYLISTGFVV